MLTCSRSDLDISQAFLQEQISNSGPSATASEIISPRIKVGIQNYGHIPHFIAFDHSLDVAESPISKTEEKIRKLRKEERNKDFTNATLLQERAKNPSDIRWQYTPLLEARIFQCRIFHY